ncbi:MAG: GTP cyclohydrolase II [Deltaproteobacteria bacterium]|nr:GTP cyclohydrolase II [Deltaproteobacteria bacterium]
MNRSSSQSSEPVVKVWKYAESKIPLIFGDFDLLVFRTSLDATEHVVVKKGDVENNEPVFLRVHSECMTGEVFSSLKCDCKTQLDMALAKIAEKGRGMIIYLRNHEGRGIGLGNKIRAYNLQNEGHDTLSANHALGFPDDMRQFSTAAEILKTLGIKKIRLNTNNPRKVEELIRRGIEVCEIVPSLGTLTPHNQDYLKTKYTQLGHRLASLFEN